MSFCSLALEAIRWSMTSLSKLPKVRAYLFVNDGNCTREAARYALKRKLIACQSIKPHSTSFTRAMVSQN